MTIGGMSRGRAGGKCDPDLVFIGDVMVHAHGALSLRGKLCLPTLRVATYGTQQALRNWASRRRDKKREWGMVHPFTPLALL